VSAYGHREGKGEKREEEIRVNNQVRLQALEKPTNKTFSSICRLLLQVT
jgi:hypothetical protein